MAEQLHLLPMRVQVGDRFTDPEGEWEVVSHPETVRGGKVVRLRAQRPGDPASAREVIWGAHERVTVRREATIQERPRAPQSAPATPRRRKK